MYNTDDKTLMEVVALNGYKSFVIKKGLGNHFLFRIMDDLTRIVPEQSRVKLSKKLIVKDIAELNTFLTEVKDFSSCFPSGPFRQSQEIYWNEGKLSLSFSRSETTIGAALGAADMNISWVLGDRMNIMTGMRVSESSFCFAKSIR